MKNKFLFSLLFIFLATGFLFFKADLAFGAEGMCTCEIVNLNTGDTEIDDVTDESKEVCDKLNDKEPFKDQFYQNCLWQDTGGVCQCQIKYTQTDEVKYEKVDDIGTEEKCKNLVVQTSGNEAGQLFIYESCEWQGGAALKPITDKGDATALDLPSVSGLNQLKSTDVKVILGTIIKVGMGLIGSIALALFAYSGVLWMVARGNAEQGKKARDIMIWAVLGLFVILASYTIVSFIFSAVE